MDLSELDLFEADIASLEGQIAQKQTVSSVIEVAVNEPYDPDEEADPGYSAKIAMISSKPVLDGDKAKKAKRKKKMLEAEKAKKAKTGSTIEAEPVQTNPGEPLPPSLPSVLPDEPAIVVIADRRLKEVMRQAKDRAGPGEKKKFIRAAAGKTWSDSTLAEWPEGDFRIFCGDLGNEVNDNTLAKVFMHYPSFTKAKVIRDKRTQKTKGFGFVSFLDPFDCAQALKEMNGKYVGNRPIKLRKSQWGKRNYAPKKI